MNLDLSIINVSIDDLSYGNCLTSKAHDSALTQSYMIWDLYYQFFFLSWASDLNF